MSSSRNDEKGYVRGARGYDGAGPKGKYETRDDFQMPSSQKVSQNGCEPGIGDYNKESNRDLSLQYGGEFTVKGGMDPWAADSWKPGPVKGLALPTKHHKYNNYPPQDPSNCKPVSPYSPSGKYGKPGGKGQRSGS